MSQRKKTPIRFDESDICDILHWFFQDQRKITEIQDMLRKAKHTEGISRQRVVSLLQSAGKRKLIRFPGYWHRAQIHHQLEDLFPGVKFCIIQARSLFPRLAAEQTLIWLRDILKDCSDIAEFDLESPDADPAGRPGEAVRASLEKQIIPKHFVAIGGGTTMGQMIAEIPNVLRARRSDYPLKEWFQKACLCFVNATAGALPYKPNLEASYLACEFAQAIRNSCGEEALSRAAQYTVSTNPSEGEKSVVQNALARTDVIVSGIGAHPDAYCIRVASEKQALTADQIHELAGEFLFHLFKEDGEMIDVNTIEVKEDAVRVAESKKRDEETLKKKNLPVLATLFGVETLAHASSKKQPAVIAVATCSSADRDAKAHAAYVLLDSHVISHACISMDLATSILEQMKRKRTPRVPHSE